MNSEYVPSIFSFQILICLDHSFRKSHFLLIMLFKIVNAKMRSILLNETIRKIHQIQEAEQYNFTEQIARYQNYFSQIVNPTEN